MPINLKIIKARQELQYCLDQLTAKYQLPGSVVDLILEAVRAKEINDQLTLLAMQIKDGGSDDGASELEDAAD